MELDVMAFSAHADDVELSCGGTIIKLAKLGYRTGACELTRGELSTRGNIEVRRAEAQKAAVILGLHERINLEIPDGRIEPTEENRLKLIRALRRYRPKLVFTSYWHDRHYDHPHTSRLVSEACFYSGLRKIDTGQEPFRPRLVIYFPHRDEFEPSFLVDISAEFEAKMAAIRAHASQFYDENSTEPETFISSRHFLDALAARMRYWGLRIGVEYAEPFLIRESIRIDDPVAFFEKLNPNRIMGTKPL